MAPNGLSERGSALWADLTAGRNWDAAGLILIAEACRVADRLERMDLLLRGELEAWTKIVVNYHGSAKEIELTLDDALAEARQQQGSLLQILTKLGLGKSEVKVASSSKSDELRAKRQARISAGQAAG